MATEPRHDNACAKRDWPHPADAINNALRRTTSRGDQTATGHTNPETHVAPRNLQRFPDGFLMERSYRTNRYLLRDTHR